MKLRTQIFLRWTALQLPWLWRLSVLWSHLDPCFLFDLHHLIVHIFIDRHVLKLKHIVKCKIFDIFWVIFCLIDIWRKHSEDTSCLSFLETYTFINDVNLPINHFNFDYICLENLRKNSYLFVIKYNISIFFNFLFCA